MAEADVEVMPGLGRKRGRNTAGVRQLLPQSIAVNQGWSLDSLTGCTQLTTEVPHLTPGWNSRQLQSVAKKIGVSLEPGAAELIAAVSDERPANLESLLERLIRAISKMQISVHYWCDAVSENATGSLRLD
jgi:hypothetical protein